MKKGKIILIVSSIFACLIIWQACQKDEEPGTLFKDAEIMQLKSGSAVILSTTGCIDPEAPEYFVVHDQLVVGWAGSDNNKFSKTIVIKYYNTLTHFVLEVMSSNGIADVLMDDVSVKNFEGTVPPGTWQQITFPLAEDWEADDTWAFGLIITGFGPPACFEVEYQLIGECVYYTLDLAVYPEGAGTLTGAGNHKAGEEVPLTATVTEGFVFVSWTDEDGNEISPDANFTYTMPAEDVTVTANFLFEVIYGDGVTDIDGNFYTSVIIGNQEWMAENLRVAHYSSGDAIPTNLSDLQWIETEIGAFAIYPDSLVEGINSKEEMVAAYGKLYNWYAVDDSRGLCPTGWHVSTDDEWTTLVNYLGRSEFAGGKLKSTRTAPDDPHPRWGMPGRRGTNESGWSGLPGGDRGTNGKFYLLGYHGHWWSSEAGTNTAWTRLMEYRFHYVDRYFAAKWAGHSVRCLRD